MSRSETGYQTDLEALRRKAEKKPNSVRAQLRLGTALVRVGFRDEGEKILNRAIELDPQCTEAWVNLGGARLSKWDFEGCIQANKEALKIDPELTMAHFNLGLGYLYQGSSDLMLQCFREVLKRDANYAAAHYYAAVALNDLDRVDEARKHLAIAVSMGYSPDPALIKELEKKLMENEELVRIMEFGPDSETNEESQ